MTEKETNQFISEFLMPRLEALSDMLAAAGISAVTTLSDDLSPGVSFRLPVGEEGETEEVFATFLCAVDAEDEQAVLLRLSYDRAGDGHSVHWAVPYPAQAGMEELSFLVKTFLSGEPFRAYPPAPEMTYENDDETTLTAEDLPADAFAVLPRLYALSDILAEEDVVQSGVVPDEIPFLQIEEDERVLTLSYRRTEDDNGFLFGIRLDIGAAEGVTEEELAQICEEFNGLHSFVRAQMGAAPFPVFGGVQEAEEGITLTACVPELGGTPEPEAYAFVISLFADAVEDLYSISEVDTGDN